MAILWPPRLWTKRTIAWLSGEKMNSADCTLRSNAKPIARDMRFLPRPRLRTVDRQRLLPAMPLEDLLDSDHQARVVWDFVSQS